MTALLMGRNTPIVVGGIAICLFAVALYFSWTGLGTSTSARVTQNSPMPPEHIEMIKALSDRLEQNPDDGKGWSMLARSYAVMGRYSESAAAYEKATNLIPNNSALLMDYAEVLATANGKNFQGKPSELIHQALKIDPNNTRALFLIGKAAYKAGDYTLAVDYWEKLLKLLPPDSPQAKQISNNIAQVRAQENSSKRPQTQGQAQPATNGAQIAGVVRLSPALASKAAPTDTVFVFAKAVSGPPMPIAVIRTQVKDLPQKFILNDSMAITPTMKLSNFKEVEIIAKVSKSGSATPQPGDLRGEVAPVKVGTDNLQLVIDKITP
jgi:cytochrome c-type biogenesis protein CcmH